MVPIAESYQSLGCDSSHFLSLNHLTLCLELDQKWKYPQSPYFSRALFLVTWQGIKGSCCFLLFGSRYAVSGRQEGGGGSYSWRAAQVFVGGVMCFDVMTSERSSSV